MLQFCLVLMLYLPDSFCWRPPVCAELQSWTLEGSHKDTGYWPNKKIDVYSLSWSKLLLKHDINWKVWGNTHFTSHVGHLSDVSVCISLSGAMCRGSTRFTSARGTCHTKRQRQSKETWVKLTLLLCTQVRLKTYSFHSNITRVNEQ